MGNLAGVGRLIGNKGKYCFLLDRTTLGRKFAFFFLSNQKIFAGTYLRYCRLIEEIETQIERCRAQWNIITNSRDEYLQDLEHLVKTRVQFKTPVKLFKFPADIYAIRKNSLEKQTKMHENGAVDIFGEVGFVQIFYLKYMHQIIGELKEQFDEKWIYWNTFLNDVKREKYEFTSVLEKSLYDWWILKYFGRFQKNSKI